MVEFCGWDMPVQYKLGIIPSHLHVRQKSGIFDVSHMLQLEITGKDRFDFLESLCVADVRGLPTNGAALSVLLTEQGTIIDDTMITRNEDHIYMVVNAGCADKDMAHFKVQLEKWKGKDVRIKNLSDNWSLVALQGFHASSFCFTNFFFFFLSSSFLLLGPDSASVLSKAIGSGAAERIAKVPFLGSFRADVFGRPCYISRLGYTGEDGFEIAMKHSDAEHICDSLVGDESAVIPVVKKNNKEMLFFFCLLIFSFLKRVLVLVTRFVWKLVFAFMETTLTTRSLLSKHRSLGQLVREFACAIFFYFVFHSCFLSSPCASSG